MAKRLKANGRRLSKTTQVEHQQKAKVPSAVKEERGKGIFSFDLDSSDLTTITSCREENATNIGLRKKLKDWRLKDCTKWQSMAVTIRLQQWWARDIQHCSKRCNYYSAQTAEAPANRKELRGAYLPRNACPSPLLYSCRDCMLHAVFDRLLTYLPSARPTFSCI